MQLLAKSPSRVVHVFYLYHQQSHNVPDLSIYLKATKNRPSEGLS